MAKKKIKPIERDESLQKSIDSFAKKYWGVSLTEAIEKEICLFCRKQINVDTEFKDAESLQEYRISGLCQTCQDEVFG